ncbi:outer membrane protein [Vibrio rarus]|uniref:outer membrane protein n=1 Tax=Vibrio rarus TaxID=413403 RepID=UPI0021C2C03D|nr:porin family protein [Vibrio rarus]
MNKKVLSLLLFACSYSVASHAEVYITPMVGYGMGGSFETDANQKFDSDSAMNYNLAVETNIDQGRLGLFYSQQDSSIKDLDRDISLRYLQFQSAVYYPVHSNVNSYLGLGVGGTQVDIQGASSDYKFSLSVYGGLEYEITDNFALQGQLRYLGTLVDSDSVTLCNSNSSGQTCNLAFAGSWLSQLQANVGFTFSF